MPLVPGLLRRRGPSSDADIRRHSLYLSPESSNPIVVDGRASEQIPRRPSAAEFLSPPIAEDSLPKISIEHDSQPGDASLLPLPIQDENPKTRRFSMLKFRHASDSHLSTKARIHAQAPPIPHPPEIITTAPTLDMNGARPSKKKSRMRLPGRPKSPVEGSPRETLNVTNEKKERRKTMSEGGPSSSKSRVTFDEPERPATHSNAPPAYGDEGASTLALPVNRLSESSRSDGSSADHGVYATTTTTTHTIHTTTTFFRLPRRKKAAPMFDLGHLPQKSNAGSLGRSAGPPGTVSAAALALQSQSSDDIAHHGFPSPLPSPAHSALAKSTYPFAPSAPLLRQGSTTSAHSSPSRARLGARGRSSTLSSLRNMPSDDPLPTPTLQSGRTSTSTGRKSFGDLFGLSHRLRQNSEPPYHASGPGTPASSASKNNSLQLVREPIVLPERHEDDTPAKYLVRLEEAVSRGVVASVLSKGTDPFSQAVLRSYMRGFGFFGDPMDMAIRKLLMEVELPKETQQIDRCLQGFANRYHECNPGIYASPDQAYFIAFSLLILHTDVFNKNNKHKMQKPDYLKNTRGEGIFDEILECFYDNISYTPFIHVEDDLDINGERIIQHKTKRKSLFPRSSSDSIKRPSKEPVDPYTIIIDSKLDTLRPNLKEVMYLEEHYSYLGTAPSLNLQDLQKTFFRTGVLQIVSARSRPDAFMSEKTVTHPEDAHPGIVDIKITKVGLLWRKDAKKKKTRSPWQEWGAILTGAQLYFFRNTAWIKNLIHQYELHIKQGHDGIPVIFKPPLDQFKPDALMSTDDAVALLDSTYKKHKNAFVFVRHGGFEETFLADNEDEMNDWLAKLNYAAAFRTSGVRMRGVVGGNYEGQRARGIRRLDSQNASTKLVQTPTGEVTIVSGKIDVKMAQDILAARREIMVQKVADAEEKLGIAQKQLDAQLRNARHLMILAPIQPKTREQVVYAAGRMAAQLKWGRMEIWRLKCHRDILMMDLDEENTAEIPVRETPASEQNSAGNLHSKTSNLTQRTPRTPIASSANRPSSAVTHQPDKDHGMESIFSTPPPQSSPSSLHKSQASWELPPLNFDGRSIRKTSVSSNLPSTPVAPTASRGSTKPTTPPSVDAAEKEVLEQAGLIEADRTPDSKRPGTGPDSEDQGTEKERDKMDKGKIRRSLHRTLREAHVPNHTRSRKGRDSASSTGMADDGNSDDVLTRGAGSFVVHGKKASVITFGSELQSMTPEERLRLRRQSHKDEPDALTAASIENEFRSTLSEPIEYHERHGSAATASTATARSFRDLHKRLSMHNSPTPVAVTSDGEDSEVASFSEGRRTPLPPVEDVGSDGGSHKENQAVYYTPETSSPITSGFQDTLLDRKEDGNEIGGEKLPGPALETAVGA
ncbi:hypothetical protein B7494_g3951 [Chlorociboria aeruginascens]|nr:hypothetical protein B7494_g3951 [Chlorociboria aeruginascens]